MRKFIIPATILFITLVAFTSLDLDHKLQQVIIENKLTAHRPAETGNSAKIELGQMLFFDKLLSGNKDVSCATCHHPGLKSGDNLALAIGVGGNGLGEYRIMGQGRERIPRNSPEIFNRGAKEWHTMFWDGRVETSDDEGFITPADEKLPDGLENILAVQAMFPVTSRDEMRGEIGDQDLYGKQNELALISNAMPQSIWFGLMQRILKYQRYRDLFKQAYPEISQEELGFQHAANAIAAFEIAAFTFAESPWDRYLSGEKAVMTESAKRGAILFYGKANCGSCHSGNQFTDQLYHNIGVPQFGPGKERAAPLDAGRYEETGKDEHRFAFRTPPLRNVAITGPYMHNGAYTSLEDAVKHHLDAIEALKNYDINQIPEDLRPTYQGQDIVKQKILASLDSLMATPILLNPQEFKDLMAYLHALTDPAANDLSALIPASVPSGLPVENLTGPASRGNY